MRNLLPFRQGEQVAYLVERKTKSGELRYLVRYRDADSQRLLTSPAFTDPAEAESYRASVAKLERRFARALKRSLSGEAMGVGPASPTIPLGHQPEPDGTRRTDPEMSFEVYARRLIQSERKAESSRTKYLRTIGSHIEGTWFGRSDIRLLTEDDVERFWRGLRPGSGTRGGEGARTSVRAVLSKVFRAAFKRGQIDRNPLARVDLHVSKSDPSDIDPLHEYDIFKIAAQANSERDRIAILIMGFCGLRPGEVAALRAQDVRDCQVRVRQHLDGDDNLKPGAKSASGRRNVGLADSVCKEVHAYIASIKPTADGRIFYSADGKLWKGHAILNAVKAAGKRAGYVVSPKLFRHSAASMLAEEGAPFREIQAFLGDSTADAALRYVHLFGPQDNISANRMENRLARSRRAK